MTQKVHTKSSKVISSPHYLNTSFHYAKELRSSKRYNILGKILKTGNRQTGNSESDSNVSLNAHKSNSDSKFESHMLTQEAVEERSKNYMPPLTKQLEGLTALIEGISDAQKNPLLTTRTSANFSAAGTRRLTLALFLNLMVTRYKSKCKKLTSLANQAKRSASFSNTPLYVLF